MPIPTVESIIQGMGENELDELLRHVNQSYKGYAQRLLAQFDKYYSQVPHDYYTPITNGLLENYPGEFRPLHNFFSKQESNVLIKFAQDFPSANLFFSFMKWADYDKNEREKNNAEDAIKAEREAEMEAEIKQQRQIEIARVQQDLLDDEASYKAYPTLRLMFSEDLDGSIQFLTKAKKIEQQELINAENSNAENSNAENSNAKNTINNILLDNLITCTPEEYVTLKFQSGLVPKIANLMLVQSKLENKVVPYLPEKSPHYSKYLKQHNLTAYFKELGNPTGAKIAKRRDSDFMTFLKGLGVVGYALAGLVLGGLPAFYTTYKGYQRFFGKHASEGAEFVNGNFKKLNEAAAKNRRK